MHQVRHSQREHDAQSGQATASLAGDLVSSPQETAAFRRIKSATQGNLPHHRFTRKITPSPENPLNCDLRMEVVYHIDVPNLHERYFSNG